MDMEDVGIMRFTACIRAVFTLVLILAILAAPFAHADEAPVITAHVTPQDLLSPAEALLSVTITNRAAMPLTDIRISADPNSKGEQFQSIEPGKSGYYELRINITEKLLAAGKVTAYITLKYDGKTRKLTSDAEIHKVSALPQIVFSCHIPRSAAYAGEVVSAEYYIKNTGAVEIRSAVIEDSAFSFVSEPFDLKPGEEKLIPCTAPLTKDVISAPRVGYVSAESGTRYVSYAGNNALRIASDLIQITVTPENALVSSGERTKITVKAENGSLLSYSDVTLTEATLGRIVSFPPVLPAQKSISHTFETPLLLEDTRYSFTLTMREAGGSVKTFTANDVTLRVQPTEARAPEFSVRADESDRAPFTFTVRGASRALTNVQLSEKRLGEIKLFTYLPANSVTAFSPELDVAADSEYVFTLEWEEDGEKLTKTLPPVRALSDTGVESGGGISQHANYAFYAIVHATGLSDAILYGSIAFIAVLISLTLGLRILKKRRRRREVQEALGRTNKFAPVRPRDLDKEKTV